jgi:hypothetical protein
MTAALALAIEVMAALILLAVSLGTLSGQYRRERDTHREWMERNAWRRRERLEGGGGYVARVITLPAVPDRFLSNGGAS